jgi:transposase
VADPPRFRSGRQFAAWIGLVPRQNSSGGKERLGGIAKQGGRYLRRLLLVAGATTVIRHARTRSAMEAGWLQGLLARRPARLALVAQANKAARVAWALLTRGGTYQARTMAVAA